jgi:hypothetical protein
MIKKYLLIAVILLSVVFLTACGNKDSQALLRERQEDITGAVLPTLVPGLTKAPSVTERVTGTMKAPTSGLEQEDSDITMTEGDLMGAIAEDISKEFYYEELSEEVIERIQGKSYKEDCDVPYSELRYVRVLYQGFDDKPHRGELIVNKAIAEDIVDIFRELYDLKYPIERMVLVDEYDGDDNASMEADNTSSFNYRKVDGAQHLSLHSYGLAIDINPLYNPYVRTIDGEKVVTPENGSKYADRSLDCEYYIDTEDACYKAFTKRGFTWGGSWINSKDYQHFQKKLD